VIAPHTSDSYVRDGLWNSYHNPLVTVKTLFRNIFIYFTPQRPCHSPYKLRMATSVIQVNFVPPDYVARIANNEHAA